MRDQHKQQTGLTKKQGELDINPNNYALKITNKYGCLQTKIVVYKQKIINK